MLVASSLILNKRLFDYSNNEDGLKRIQSTQYGDLVALFDYSNNEDGLKHSTIIRNTPIFENFSTIPIMKMD